MQSGRAECCAALPCCAAGDSSGPVVPVGVVALDPAPLAPGPRAYAGTADASVGFYGRDSVSLSGGSTDSYDPAQGQYNPLTAGAHGNVTTNGNITVSGGGKIAGDARAGGTITLSGGSTVTGQQ